MTDVVTLCTFCNEEMESYSEYRSHLANQHREDVVNYHARKPNFSSTPGEGDK